MSRSRSFRRSWGSFREVEAPVRLCRPWGGGALARIWWVVLLRALAAVAFGVVIVAWPRHAILALVMAFGVYAAVDGTLGLTLSAWPGALRAPRLAALAALANITAGAAALFEPRKVSAILIILVGVWLAIRGGASFVEALVDVRARRRSGTSGQAAVVQSEFAVLVEGLMAGVFGLFLLVAPHLGLLTVAWALGVWAVLHGVLMVAFAFDLLRREQAGAG